MNAKQKLKVKDKVEELIVLIEKNDLESVKKMVENCKKILKMTKMDDNEPIFYAIKYRCNKIFNYILENSTDIEYDIRKLFGFIAEFGTEKMFRTFIQFYKIDLNMVDRHYILLIFKYKICKVVEVLLNELEFCYSFKISRNAYDVLNYNFPITPESDKMEVDGAENDSQKKEIRVVVNKSGDREDFSLDLVTNESKDCRFRIIFHRYKKLFLVRSKSLRPPKNLRPKDYQEIIKYL